MNNKSITPNPQQPVDRVPTGQLPSALAELSEAELSADKATASYYEVNKKGFDWGGCSYDGDDE